MPHKENPEGYLSVTQVLDLTINKPFLAMWRGRIGNEAASKIQQESQEIGTEVHRLIEERFKVKNDEVYYSGSGRTKDMCNNFWNKFVIPFDVKPLELEVTMQDKKLKLQGTMDAIIQIKKSPNHMRDGLYLMDWKTSASIDKISAPLQLSAYQWLYGVDGTDVPDSGGIVRIDKESDKVEVKWYENLEQYWPIFKAAMRLARWIKFQEV